MPLMIQRILYGLAPVLDTTRAVACSDTAECVVLRARSGNGLSDKPPVRIFLGSERAQFRAERAFIWSVEKQRDPTRIYEIYVLRELRDFDRRFWLTGFSNYRFAVPAFCNFGGRAIYNDADQLYLCDPAELFDLDMQGAGYLSINEHDTSVMLIDCRAMARVWSEAVIHRISRRRLEARACAEGCWRRLDAAWNARDAEYHPDTARLVHFTALQTQPWRPLPERFVYIRNQAAQQAQQLWLDLEREADEAEFLPVNARRPSKDWSAARSQLRATADPELLALLRAKAPVSPPCETRSVAGVLERVPDADLPWVLDRLFAASRHVSIRLREPLWPRCGGRLRRNRHFWLQHLDAAARRHRATVWQLDRRVGLSRRRWYGGPARAGEVLVLSHRKPGHDNQALALGRMLAAATGRELRHLPLAMSEAGFLARRLVGLRAGGPAPANTALIVASGWMPTRVARHMAAGRGGDVRLVLMGRKAGPVPRHGAVVVRCRHFDLPPNPAQIETLLPLNAGSVSQSAPDTHGWQRWFEAPRRVALLVGGDSRSHRLDVDHARRLASQASAWARSMSARLLVVTSRRTGRALEGLREGLGREDLLYQWRQDDAADNPYALALAKADALTVTGESESMLADAVATGRPVLIWPLHARRDGLWQRLGEWARIRAMRPRYNRRGSLRPQQGLAYLCARALERGWLLPPRRPERLHLELIEQGRAAWFGSPMPEPDGALEEVASTAARVIELLLLDAPLRPHAAQTQRQRRQRLTHGRMSL